MHIAVEKNTMGKHQENVFQMVDKLHVYVYQGYLGMRSGHIHAHFLTLWCVLFDIIGDFYRHWDIVDGYLCSVCCHKILYTHGIDTSHLFGIEWGLNGDTVGQ